MSSLNLNINPTKTNIIIALTPDEEKDRILKQMKQTKAHNINENECKLKKPLSTKSIRRIFWSKGPSS